MAFVSALLLMGLSTGCSCNKEVVQDPEENNNGKSEEAKDEIDDAQEDILEIVSSCVSDSFDADGNMDDHIDEIRSNPAVSDVQASDNGVQVTYTNGEVQCFIYDYGSVFDDPGEASKSSPSESFPVTTKVYDKFSNKKVYVFNLFSEDGSRANQNDMVNKTVDIFRHHFGDGNVKYYGFKDFTFNNLREALVDRDCMAIYVYSFGLDQYVAVGGGYYTPNKMYDINIKGVGLSDHYREMTPVGNVISQMLSHSYYGIDMDLVIRKIDCDLSGKMIYLSSCNTLTSPFNDPSWPSHKACVVGWDGVNKLGEAYGLIMTHYMLSCRRDLATFLKCFQNSAGEIEDKYAGKGAKLKVKGGISNYNFWANVDAYIWYTESETKEDAKIIFTAPENGGCLDVNLLVELGMTKNTKLKYKYLLDRGESIGMLESTQPGGYVYFIRGYDLGDLYYYGMPLDCKWSTSTTFHHFLPGVMRYELIQQPKNDWDSHRDCDPEGNWNIQDAIYVITPHRFRQNDAGQPTEPDIRSLTALEAGGKMYVYGGVVDMEGKGYPKGFQYWKNGEGSSVIDVGSEVDETLFYAALPKVQKGAEYSFKAYLIGPDGKYYFGDVISFVSEVDTDSSGVNPTPVAVDMGLSVKWASCNVGSTSPEEYGDYYAWGDVNNYTGDNYSYIWTPVLLPSGRDVAHVKYGGNWRMPSLSEIEELIDPQKTIMQSEELNGVAGLRIQSRTTGNSIFLPFSGAGADGTEMCGSMGHYWSATGCSREKAYYFYVSENGPDKAVAFRNNRANGLSVRAVFGNDALPRPESRYVDLGLQSGTLWANCNIGADNPEESGNLYAYSETSPKENYSSENYSPDYGVDPVTRLLGSDWTLPSYEQFQELYDYCGYESILVGGQYVDVLTGPNGNILGLPKTGYMAGDELYDRGKLGYFWCKPLSSSSNTWSFWAWWGTLYEEDDANWSLKGYYGLAYRPVYVGTKPNVNGTPTKAEKRTDQVIKPGGGYTPAYNESR